MLLFLLRRLSTFLPTFLGVTVVSFAFVRLLPGDPILLLAGERGVSPERYAQLLAKFGFDQPLWRQYIEYLGGVLSGDFGVSFSTKRPVLDEFFTLFPATLELSITAMILAVALGIPAGVINWVPGDREVGAHLVSHPGINKVAFTGSTAAGRKIAEVCGRLLRPVTLELGGKSAAIILEDAEIAPLLEGMGFASFGNNGQTCAASTRILVPASRYDEIVDAVAGMAKSLKVGSSLDPETQIGPMASEAHRNVVERYIAKGKTEARLVAGGGRPKNAGNGWFVEPTVFADVDNNATISQEEIFGPVLSIIKYQDEDDAVRIANDSDFGLGGTVWSKDSLHAQDVARRVQTGSIGVNGYMLDINAPFGGVKASGMGRELGPESLNSYLAYKSVYLPAG